MRFIPIYFLKGLGKSSIKKLQLVECPLGSRETLIKLITQNGEILVN